MATSTSTSSRRLRWRAALAVIPAVLLAGTFAVEHAGGESPPHGEARFHVPGRERGRNPRLAPSLYDDVDAGRPVLSARPDHVPDPPRGMVTVVVDTSDVGAARQAVESGGGTVVGDLPTLLKAHVPPGALEHVASSHGVTFVREPFYPRLAATSEGVAETGAAPWHDAEWVGTGSKVAILDSGFAGWEAARDAGELPAGTAIIGGCGVDSSSHGTAIAEIIHDMAPGAELLLVCVMDDFNFAEMMETMPSKGVDIINASFGFTLTGRGDGSGAPYSIAGAVASVREQGVLFVSAASNYGMHHFHTNAVGDAPGDANTDFVNISPDDAFRFTVPGNGVVNISVQWDAWPTTRQDFDVYVRSAHCPNSQSVIDQAGAKLPPIEYMQLVNCSDNAQTFSLFVNRYSGTATPRIDLWFDGDVTSIEHTSASSIVEPGSSPAAMAVGAHCASSGVRQPYSSQGPSIDGRIKPDISGPDAVSTSVNGPASGCGSGLRGTSAAAAHVSGAAALMLGASPDLDVAELQQLLQDHAFDAGAPGFDNQYGAGRLRTGAAGDAAVPTAQPYTSAGPVRLLDTRPGALGASEPPFGAGGRTTPIPASGSLRLQASGVAGVPADAVAVVLNVTAVAPTKAGYLTVFPDGGRPTASNLNFAAGQTVGVNVTATIAPDGQITIYNSAGSTHVVVDLAGWYGPTGSGGPATARFNALPSPRRALNTQPSQTGYGEVDFGPAGVTAPLGPNQGLSLRVAGIGGVAADATAVIVNVAVVTPNTTGYLTLYADGSPKPVASSINFGRQTIANLAVVPVGPGGRIRIHNAQGTTHVVIDVVGAFRPGVGAGYVALDPPRRQLNTLTGTGLCKVPLGTIHNSCFLTAARYGGVPADALATSMSVAVVRPSATGYIKVYPLDQFGATPMASNINFTPGIVLANAVVAKVGYEGKVAFTSSAGLTDVAADLVGYFIDPANQPVPWTEPPPPFMPPVDAPADSATTYQGNAVHDGSNAATLFDPTPEEAWRHDFNGTLAYTLLVNGRVFAVATRPDGQQGANLFALDADDGSVLWGPKPVGGAHFITGIAADGTNVYSVSYGGRVTATDQASGLEVWRRQLGQSKFTSPPTVDQGVVFVGGSGAGATMYALDAHHGTVIWEVGGYVSGDHSAPTVTADAVYVSFSCSIAYRIDRFTGFQIWKHVTGCSAPGGRTTVLHGDRLYIRDVAWGLSALSTTTGADVGTHQSLTAPAFHAGKGFYVADGAVTAVTLATGTTAWTKTGDGSLVTAPLVVDGKVIVGSSTGKVFVFDEATGADLSSPDTGLPIEAPDEDNTRMLAGLAVAESTLLVPASDVLVAYR
jgi:outer membrane protein assembly factor BamB